MTTTIIADLQAEVKRLKAELATVRADYQTYVDGVDHAMDEEVKRLRDENERLKKGE